MSWQKYPSSDAHRRWLILEPDSRAPGPGDVAIDINVGDTIGSRMASFSFRVEPEPGYTLGRDPISVSVQSANTAGQTSDLVRRTSLARGDPVVVPSDDVSATIPDDASRVRISFRGVDAHEMVRVIELQIVSDDVKPSITDSICAQP